MIRNVRSRAVMAAAAGVCMLFTLSSTFGGPHPQGKGKPAPAPRATVSIESLDIQSDGYGDYVDGRDGVSANVATSGSYDFGLDLIKSSRRFNVNVTGLPSSSYSIGYYINVREIGNMELGDIKWTRAHFYVDPQFKGTRVFNWCGVKAPSADELPPGVTLLNTANTCNNGDYLVSVKCLSGDPCTEWTVSTFDDLDPYSKYINPISALVEATRTTTVWGNYSTAFKLHIWR